MYQHKKTQLNRWTHTFDNIVGLRWLFKKHSTKYYRNMFIFTSMLSIVMLFSGLAFLRSDTHQIHAANNIEAKAFNKKETDIKRTATQRQMNQLAALGNRIHNRAERQRVVNLSKNGEQALTVQRQYSQLFTKSDLIRQNVSTKQVKQISENLMESELRYKLPAFYSHKNHELVKLNRELVKLHKLDKATDKLFVKKSKLKKNVTEKKVNKLIDKLVHYSRFELAQNDLNRLEKAQAIITKRKQVEESSVSSAAVKNTSSSSALSSSEGTTGNSETGTSTSSIAKSNASSASRTPNVTKPSVSEKNSTTRETDADNTQPAVSSSTSNQTSSYSVPQATVSGVRWN